MKYRYYTCDVFTDKRFGGNQLAVLPDAKGLTSEQMQQITREFNYSETTFVLPPESGHTRKVRIFTPATEVPFAGHPNIGTAFVLANTGELGEADPEINIEFEEKAGIVPIRIRMQDANTWCELKAPEDLSIGLSLSPELLASALFLPVDDILMSTHPPQVASVGLPFIMVELKDRGALERIRINMPAVEKIHSLGFEPYIHCYTRVDDGFDVRVRVFVPMDGVPEDPATGSANCALAALLAHYRKEEEGDFSWRIAQGVEMKRPSVLDARAEKRSGKVSGVWIAGSSRMVCEGFIEV